MQNLWSHWITLLLHRMCQGKIRPFLTDAKVNQFTNGGGGNQIQIHLNLFLSGVPQRARLQTEAHVPDGILRLLGEVPLQGAGRRQLGRAVRLAGATGARHAARDTLQLEVRARDHSITGVSTKELLEEI